jgi:tRNA(Ile)-lysidine synthase
MRSALKLQDIFTNEKVPRSRRHDVIVAVAASGEVFWVEGLRISERFKITDGTARCLEWRWGRI